MFQKPAIGLDISDHSIEAVLVVRRGDRLVVASYGRTTLPPGAIVDGYVERRDVVSLALRKLLADKMTPPLPKGLDRAVFALPESQVYGHIFEVPRVADDAELGRSLAVEADGYFPYRHEEMVSGYAVIAQRPDRKDIYYASVHKDTLKSYLDLFAASGIGLEAVEGESAAIARATLLPNESDPVLYVDVGARVANVAVFDRSGIQFSEALETAGDAFTQALARALGISDEDADSLKRSHGLSGDVDLKAQKAMRATADRLVKDVAAVRDYYEAKSSRPIGRVIMCGGTTLMPGLVEHLSAGLSVPGRTQRVERADPWAGLEIDPVLERLNVRERGVLATTAVGLALRGLGIRKFADINLLPASVQNRAASAYRAAAGPRPSNHEPDAQWHPPTWLKLGLAVLGVLALAAGAWLLAFRLRAPRAEAPAQAPAAMDAPDQLPIETAVAVGNVFSESPPTLALMDLDLETEAQVAVDRPGTETAGYAKGVIEIVNESGNGQTLVATTRFLSESGVIFRLDTRVFVPARGRVTAGITADQPGASGDVGIGRFTIPGLASATQALIYGETAAPTSGGLTTAGAPFTEDDLVALRGRLEAEAASSLEAAAVQKAGIGLLILPGTFKMLEVRFLEAPSVGQPTASFTARAIVRAKVTAVDRAEAETLLRKVLPSSDEGSPYVLSTVEAVLDATGAAPTVRLKAVADRRQEEL